MSRGLGALQESVLQALRAAAHPTTEETLRWSLRENCDANRVCEGLPNSWNTSFARAIQGLAERGLLSIEARRLETFEECVRHYPGKTLDGEKRSLRQTFLPTLLKWIREDGGIDPRYNAAENEEFRLRQVPEEKLQDITTRWRRIEGGLRPLYGGAGESADDILRLICKGRSLFGPGDVQVRVSLAYLTSQALRGNTLPDWLSSELRALEELFLPKGVARTLRLKSFIRRLADVPTSGKCSLKSETLAYLHGSHPEIVARLSRPKRDSVYVPEWGPKFGEHRFTYHSKLKDLIDHTVFQRFRFVTSAC